MSTSREAAEAGPFPTGSTNLQSAFADDFSPDVTLITGYSVSARSGTQAITGTAGTTGGYTQQFSNTVMALLLIGGTTITYAEGPPRYGYNVSADTRLPDGSIRGNRNGIPVALRSASPTYVNVTGTPSTTMGRGAGGTANACTGTTILWKARLMRAATDAELLEWTGVVNQLDRYRPPQSLIDALNATPGSKLFEVYTDYAPVAATSTGSIGGQVWTRNGSPAKTTIEPEVEHVIDLSEWHHNVLDLAMTAQVGSDTYQKGNPFREFKFRSDASRFAVKLISDWAGGFLASIGVRQDGVPLTPLTPDANFMWRRLDVVGLSGSHDYRIVDGMQSIVGSITGTFYNGTGIKGVTSAIIQIPQSAAFAVIEPEQADNVLVVTGDSFHGKESDVTPTTEASIMRLRDRYPGSVIAFTYLAAGHWSFTGTSGTTVIDSFVSDLLAAFSGATSKRWLDDLSANDHNVFSSFWSSRSQMRTRMGALFDAVHAADSSITIHLRTGLLRSAVYEGSTVSDATGPGTGSGTQVGGAIFQDIRDDYETVRSTRTAFMSLFNGKSIFPNFGASPNHSADNFHPSSTGQLTIALAAAAYLSAAADSVGANNMTTTPKRLYGPAALTTSAATKYTAPAGGAQIKHIHVDNPGGGSTRTFTLSIGADAAGTRVYDALAIPAGGLDLWGPITLGSGEIVQAFADNAALVLTVDGVEYS